MFGLIKTSDVRMLSSLGGKAMCPIVNNNVWTNGDLAVNMKDVLQAQGQQCFVVNNDVQTKGSLEVNIGIFSSPGAKSDVSQCQQ